MMDSVRRQAKSITLKACDDGRTRDVEVVTVDHIAGSNGFVKRLP
jgi:hypothetical protein